MAETNEIIEHVLANSDKLNDLTHHVVQLDAVLAAVEELMEDLDEAVHNGWHKERTAELIINTVAKKVRMIDMALRPLNRNMNEKIIVANDAAEEIVNFFEHYEASDDSKVKL